MKTGKNLLFVVLIVLAMLSRLIPHAPNFTAVAAAGLFAGFAFGREIKSFLIPLVALWLSDLLINNIIYAQYYEGFRLFTPGFYWIYGGMLAAVVIGRIGLSSFKILPLAGAGLSSAVVFYIITNFGAWIGNPLYAQNISGLMASYTAALPFLLNQVLGTFFYGAIIFGAAYAFTRKPAVRGVNA